MMEFTCAPAAVVQNDLTPLPGCGRWFRLEMCMGMGIPWEWD